MTISTMKVQTNQNLLDARTRLLAAVDEIAPILDADNLEAETTGAPTARVVEAFRKAGLIGLKAPKEVGGDELDWTSQIDVFERVARSSFSAAWCLVIYADVTGMACSRLPQSALDRIMRNGQLPVICGGGGRLMGTLSPVEGGFQLTGRWIFGSGIPQADYALIPAAVPARDGEKPDTRIVVVSVSDLIIEDNWHVMGLKGTGSSDFRAEDIFVPEDMTFGTTEPVKRGGPIFRMSNFGYASLGFPGLAVGAVGAALDQLAQQAAAKSRGYDNKTTLAHRGVFQSFLGEADLKLKAAKALAVQIGEQLVDEAATYGESSPATEAEARAVGTYIAQIATEVMNGIIGYGGGSGVRAGHKFERTLRDMHMAMTHIYVSDISYENHAQFLMHMPGASLQV